MADWCTLHGTNHSDSPCENVRKYTPPTRFPGQGSYSGSATMARWNTRHREDPQDRADRRRSQAGTDIRRYRDVYSSEDQPRRHDHPNKWNKRHEAEQRRVNRKRAATLGVEL